MEFFTPKNPEKVPNLEIFFPELAMIFKVLLKNRIFFDNLASNVKMLVAFLRNDPIFFLKSCVRLLAKYTECVPITIMITKLYGNKLMLPVGLLFTAG